MIETYGFFLVFALQVLALSVLYPARFSQYVRRHAQSLPQERLARLYPGIDLEQARERFLSRFRAVNGGIAIVGLVLLGWFFSFMRPSGWDDGQVIAISGAYGMLQYLPAIVVAWLGFRLNREFRSALQEGKRKATLQRRGLFDFVSPVVVFLTLAGYIAIFPFVLLVQQKPWPGYALLGVLTLTYLVQGWVIYRTLYGKKMNPLEAPELRAHRIGMTVRTGVYGLLLCTVFFAFVFVIDMVDMKRWVPLAQTVCLLFSSIFCLMAVSKPPREAGTGPGSAPAASHH